MRPDAHTQRPGAPTDRTSAPPQPTAAERSRVPVVRFLRPGRRAWPGRDKQAGRAGRSGRFFTHTGLSGEDADDRERCVDIGRPACESAPVPRPPAAGSPTRQIAVLPATHDQCRPVLKGEAPSWCERRRPPAEALSIGAVHAVTEVPAAPSPRAPSPGGPLPEVAPEERMLIGNQRIRQGDVGVVDRAH
jgi:hypothetical protein